MATHERTLVIVRHAKAEPAGPSDFDRPLARSGLGDALAAGEWMAARGVVPQAALVSAALRTQQTWEQVARGAGWAQQPSVDLDRGLYAAEPETVLDLVRTVDRDPGCVLVLGHNPTMAGLALLLDGGAGDPGAGRDLATGFPTCALAVLSVPVPWGDLTPASASVLEFHVARA